MQEQNQNIEDFQHEEQSTLLSYRMKKFTSNKLPMALNSVQTSAKSKPSSKERNSSKQMSFQSYQLERKARERQYKFRKLSQSWAPPAIIKNEYEDLQNYRSRFSSLRNQKNKRKSRFFTPQKQNPVKFEFIKLASNRSASSEVTYQSQQTENYNFEWRGNFMYLQWNQNQRKISARITNWRAFSLNLDQAAEQQNSLKRKALRASQKNRFVY